MSGVPRESLVFRAKLAQQCGRDEDMLANMRLLAADADVAFTSEERNLLSLAFKNVVQNLRSSLSIARAIECRERQLSNDAHARLAREYVEKLSRELRERCADAVACVETRVEASAAEDSVTARVFWLKCLGDYWRYTCEVDPGGGAATNAEDAYRAGIERARSEPMTSALRLGLYLNHTVLLYEIMGNKRGALDITDACLRLTRGEIASMEDSDEREDTEAVVALLRNNAALWRREIEAEREGLRVDITERADSLATTKDDAHDDDAHDDDDPRTDSRAREPIDLRALHL